MRLQFQQRAPNFGVGYKESLGGKQKNYRLVTYGPRSQRITHPIKHHCLGITFVTAPQS